MEDTLELNSSELHVEVSAHGAELKKIQHKATGKQLLWSGDPHFWRRHSPVLFPIVGKLKEGKYRYKGKTYQLPQHGFARDMDFQQIPDNQQGLAFMLEDNEETHEVYPFQFRLEVRYKLSNNKLKVTYKVYNSSETEKLLYSIGGHPAFRAPVFVEEQLEDYRLIFSKEETIANVPLVDGLRSDSVGQVILDQTEELNLGDHLFVHDAVVFEDLKSDKVMLINKQESYKLILDFKDFPYLGIWKKAKAPFLCLEPWAGMADFVESNQEFVDKKGLRTLEPKGCESFSWEVEFKLGK